MVSGSGDRGEGTRSRASVTFDRLPGPNIDLDLPNAVPPRVEVEGETGMSLDFWADQSGNGVLDDRDHRWRIDDACSGAPEPIEFAHSLDFDPLPQLPDAGSKLIIGFCGGMLAPPIPDTAAVEVRVRGTVPANPEVNGDVEREQAIAFHRVGTARDLEGIIEILRPIDSGQEMLIEVVIDLNGNGVFNDGDVGYRYDYTTDPPDCPLISIGDLCARRSVDPCLNADGNIAVSVSRAHVGNEQAPSQASWWHLQPR